MDTYRIFVKKTGLVGITNFLVAINIILLIPILTKNLGANNYGIWIQVMTTFYLVTNLANLGFPFTMIRFLSAETDRGKIQEIFYSMSFLVLIFGIIVLVLIILLSNQLAIYLFDGNLFVVLLMAVSIFFGSLNSLFIDFFLTSGYIKRYSFILIFQTYLSLILISYFAFFWHSISMVIFGFLISQIIICLLMISLITNEINFTFPKFEFIKDILDFSLPTIPSNLSTWIVESSDRYIIGIILGTVYVGYYSPGYSLGMIILLISTPLSVLLLSVLPKYYEKDQLDEVMKFINYSIKYFLLIAIPVFFCLAILSKPILMIITTPEIAYNGYLITPIIAFCSLLFGVYSIIINLIILKKKTRIIGIIWLLSALISLLSIIFVPYFGIIAAAIITLLSYSFALVLGLKYTLKFFKFNFPEQRSIIKSIFASTIMSVIILFINPSGILEIISVIIISLMIYSFLMLITKGIKNDDLKFIKRLLIDS